MIYSIWDWNKLQYKYYKAPGDLPGTRPLVSKINEPTARVGRQIETLMPSLPGRAQLVGSGKVAKGRIVASAQDRAINTSGELGPGLSGVGLSGFSAEETLSPLLTSPWKTLGIWFVVVYTGMQAAFWIGKSVENSYRKSL